jgi:hypothetical protein
MTGASHLLVRAVELPLCLLVGEAISRCWDWEGMVLPKHPLYEVILVSIVSATPENEWKIPH